MFIFSPSLLILKWNYKLVIIQFLFLKLIEL